MDCGKEHSGRFVGEVVSTLGDVERLKALPASRSSCVPGILVMDMDRFHFLMRGNPNLAGDCTSNWHAAGLT